MSFRRWELARRAIFLLALLVGQAGGFANVPAGRAAKNPDPFGPVTDQTKVSPFQDQKRPPREDPRQSETDRSYGGQRIRDWLRTEPTTQQQMTPVRPAAFQAPVPAPPLATPVPVPVPPPRPLAPPAEPVPMTPLPPTTGPFGPASPIDPPFPIPPPPAYGPTAEPLFGETLRASQGPLEIITWPFTSLWHDGVCCLDECGPWRRLFYLGIHEESYQPGIGHDRVMLAPFFIPISQPFNSYRVRIDDVTALPFPTRGGFFWAPPTKGPIRPEQTVDYQDFRLQIQVGNENFSIATGLPLRLVDPVVNDNTGGFSDMTLTQRAVMVDGEYWQITQYFRTYFPTGSAHRGLGTGHTSLEPGVLARYKWNDWTYIHSELLYWFPLGGNPIYAGQHLKYGIGVSTVLYENDRFAAMPTLEWVGWYFFDGAKTLPNGRFVNIDGLNLFNIHPGIRFVLGPRDDLGLFSIGVAGGLPLGNPRLYDGMLRIEMRWTF